MSRVITAISNQKRNPRRVNIELDGQFAFSLDRLTAAWLTVGSTLSEEKAAALLRQDANESAFNNALRLLSYRSRSRKELEQYLQRKGYAPEQQAVVLERLQAEGYLDDQRFAREWVENRTAFRPRGLRMLRMEMRRKGISDNHIDAAISQASLDEDRLAYQAGIKLARRYKAEPEDIFFKLLASALVRRGFDYETAKTAVRKIWNEFLENKHLD
ncbi:MAG: regulatory protein RecX [Anaerolineaceae bacterium]|jgi:regulatory protein